MISYQRLLMNITPLLIFKITSKFKISNKYSQVLWLLHSGMRLDALSIEALH